MRNRNSAEQEMMMEAMMEERTADRKAELDRQETSDVVVDPQGYVCHEND